MKEKIDVVILTYNEEEVIEDAIKSVKSFAEKIIVVDSESNDDTGRIAKNNGASVYIHPFKNFSEQRNFALQLSHSSWIFYLDADERVTAEFKDELLEALNESNFSAFIVKRRTFYFGKDWGFEDEVPRIFWRESFKNWTGVVHETPHFMGKSGRLKNPILHYTHRNLRQMLQKTNEWSEYEAKLRHDAHHPPMKPWRFLRVMVSEFFRNYIKLKGYRNGTHGFIESVYQSYSMFITYAKLWELQNKK